MSDWKFEIFLTLLIIVPLSMVVTGACWKAKKQQIECDKFGATIIYLHRTYICVKDGLIIDKNTGEVVGLNNEDQR